MGRPRGSTTRTRRKAAPPAPELEAMVDTIVDDGVNPDEVKAPRASRQRPGPRKVLSETSKIVGDGLAVGVMLATSQPDTRKNLTMPEAQSIGHPVARMVGRRVPGWLKPLLPRTKLSPEDAADLEEIFATLAKWTLRLVTIMVQDVVEGREKAKKGTQQQAAVNHTQQAATPSDEFTQMSLEALRLDAARKQMAAQAGLTPPRPAEQAAAFIAQPTQNGHNPAFDTLLNVDFGIEV